MWTASPRHAQSILKDRSSDVIKHTHLPRSIWAATIILGRLDRHNFNVTLDIEQCCVGPSDWMAVPINCPHQLKLDGMGVYLSEYPGERIVLGDYGDLSGGFARKGNIFEDMQGIGIDPTDMAYRPVVSQVSGDEHILRDILGQDGTAVTVTFHDEHERLALYRPQGFSLQKNQQLALLLKALSTRLAGKHLVTRVIQCSHFDRVNSREQRRGGMAYTLSKARTHSTQSDILTPLCTVASPRVWQREPACMKKRGRFEDIRKHFYTIHRSATEALRSHGNGQVADEAIKFFSDMFDFEYLQHYVGEITFFKRLPFMAEMESASKGRLKSGHQSKARQDPRLKVVLPLLRKECQILLRQNSIKQQKIQDEVRHISQTLSAGILQHISMAFTCGHSRIDYHGQLNAGSVLNEIDALQMKLDATEKEAEHRALEEDITGKILWFCWHAICLEVHELLSEVLSYIRKAGKVYGLLKIGQIIERMHPDLDDDQAHLHRIMADARAGTSKHQLWLAATAAQHCTNLQDTIISRDKPIRNMEEIKLGTSSQASFTSVVL